ncbi:MAG: EamA family transporter [Clostridia bacterium]|nr:EamA family transporter [Clostridia bacterium]
MGKAYGKYIGSLLIFGFNGIVASQIALSSYEIVFARTLLGSLFLILAFSIAGRKWNFLKNGTHMAYIAASGAAMGASWIFLYEAYRQIGVGMASLAYYCGPVIVMALSPVLFKEKLTWAKGIGLFGVLVGMVCINTQGTAVGKSPWGLFCGLMSAVLYAVMVVFNKKAKNMPGLENAMVQVIASFLTVALFLLAKQGFTIRVAPGSLAPILILGIVNTGLGCFFYFSSIGELPVQSVAVCGYLEPLAAVVFSGLFLKEKMNGAQILGAMLILGGAAFGELLSCKAAQKHGLALGRTSR